MRVRFITPAIILFICAAGLSLTVKGRALHRDDGARSSAVIVRDPIADQIKGTLFDSSGAAVSGAEVSARNIASGEVSNDISKSDGTFMVPLLERGTYQLVIIKEGFKSKTINDIESESINPAPLEVTVEPSAEKENDGRISLRPEVFVQGRFSRSPVRSAEAMSEIDLHLTRLEVGWSGKVAKHVGIGFEVKVHNAVYGEPRGMLNDAFVDYEINDHLKVTAGQFVKPFGFDVQQSTSRRESPERGMFAGYFFPGERGRGIMVSGDLNAFSNHALRDVSYSVALFSGNLFFDRSRAQPNFVVRVRKLLASPHLVIGISMQRGNQFLTEGLPSKTAENIYGLDLQYTVCRLDFRAELAGGHTPSYFFSSTSEPSMPAQTAPQAVGGALLAVYRLTSTDNAYARYDQFNGDPRAGGNIRAFNFGYVRQVGKYSRVDFDYQFKNRASFNDDAANRRLQITWSLKF